MIRVFLTIIAICLTQANLFAQDNDYPKDKEQLVNGCLILAKQLLIKNPKSQRANNILDFIIEYDKGNKVARDLKRTLDKNRKLFDDHTKLTDNGLALSLSQQIK